MNLDRLIDKVEFYFESAADLTTVEIIEAINAARKAAEAQYAFELNKKVLQASVDARTGGVWTSLPEINTATPVFSVRSLKRAYVMSDDGLGFTEIRFDYKGLLKFNAQDPMQSVTIRDGPDRKIYVLGNKLYFYPFGTAGTVTNLALDAYVWMDNYLTTDLIFEDWMLEHHSQYLFWRACWDLNFKKKEWVPRQEGNLQLSLDNANMEFQRMVALDSATKSYQTSLNELM